MDGGTLYQLRNLINWRNVVSDPSNDVNSCEDFFLLVLTAHILAAAMEILGMQSLSDTPDETLVPTSATSLKIKQQQLSQSEKSSYRSLWILNSIKRSQKQ